MAGVEQNKLGIKIEGDLDDLQIIEEASDSEDGESNQAASTNTLSDIPADLSSVTKAPVFGTVAVTNSENVHFGDKYIKIYNGPISIKQIVQTSSGIDNGSYVKTEVENVTKSEHPGKEEKEKKSTRCQFVHLKLKMNNGDILEIQPLTRFQRNTWAKSQAYSITKHKLQTWHKLTCSAAAVVLLCGIFAVVLLVQDRYHLSANDNFHFDTDNSNNAEVMDIYHKQLQVIIVSMAVVPLAMLMICCSFISNKLITVNGGEGRMKKVETGNGSNVKRISDIKADELLLSPNQVRIVSRTDWLAQPVEKPLDKIRQPVPWVIITHTATESCHSQSGCVLAVRLIQTFHIESRNWYDIGYNFLVGGDGSAYCGRGWDYIGAHTKFFNKYSISIAFIGTFNKEVPPTQQLEACKKLIKVGVEEGMLAKDYKLFAHRQLMSTLSPGDALYDIIKEWPHFVSNYTSDMIPNY